METLSLNSAAEVSTELSTQQTLSLPSINSKPAGLRKKTNLLESRLVDILVETGAWAMAVGEVYLLIKIITYLF